MRAARFQTQALSAPTGMAALAQPSTALGNQSPQAQVRELARACQRLSQHYQRAPERCFERAWWRRLHQAGMLLHAALERAKATGYCGLDDQEVEQAYLLLIHIAYFFEPGGVVEALWPLLPPEDEQEEQPVCAAEVSRVAFARR